MPVTVVVPTRDRAALLRQTLWSVRSQRPEPRVVVVDDGSADETPEVVAAAGATLVRNPAGGWGAGGSRNEGLRYVETELVCFVDSDDLLVPGALGRLTEALEAHPDAPFAAGAALVGLDSGGTWAPYGFIAPSRAELERGRAGLYVRNWVPSSGVLARVDALRAVGGYDERLTYSEDHELWLRLATLGDPVHVHEITSVYRRHPENRHHAASASRDDSAITALADDDPALAAVRAEREGTRLAEAAVEAVRSGSPSAVASVVEGWLRGPERDRTARAAARHVRRRRAAAAAGRRAWAERPDLVEWLERSRSA
jgi:glycosyltransferase involved in cell wall biosynthesis